MNSSNSVNICPRCANSNSLNAKYCSRCGAQLKVPTEAVVCHKCHTRNSSLANFCRSCGATLKVGAQTKQCPRCGNVIGAEEKICACGYSFVTMQQTEPKRANVSSTNKDNKRDKKREKNKPSNNIYAQSGETVVKEKKPKQKKGGRGFALFAFLILAVFVVAIILPASARGPLVNFDKGFYHPVEETAEPQALVDSAAQLYAEDDGNEDVTTPTENEGGENEGGETEPVNPPVDKEDEEDPAPVETWTVTFKNGEETVNTVEVTKGEKLTAEQIPANPAAPEGKEFKGWFSGETQITVDAEINGDIIAIAEYTTVSLPDPTPNPNPDPEPTPDPDPEQPEPAAKLETNVYGWDLINDVIGLFSEDTKAAMGEYSEGAFKYIVNEYFGSATFMMVAMLAVFVLTAVFHLLVCLARIISPKRSKRPNYLYLLLAVVTTVIAAMMVLAHFIPNEESGFRLFFAPLYKGMTCNYGLMVWAIPVYYWFFWLYSYIAKKKTPKKPKKGE